ncbi:tissue-type plasminogen activator [Callorhinchus milii]|uniref:tissue-type plasminogen activator n=1 Tax=Callorhinchus milii TaxID=7868 RepID=UPI001C3FDED6|nr:tissue-type plasminogen activator [Callorhinchus milii]XP_007896870.2 tissue-type plasminogen activator [Callorhinchus milii]
MKILFLALLLSFIICVEMIPMRKKLNRMKNRVSSKRDKCVESPTEIYRRGQSWLRLYESEIQKCTCTRRTLCYNVRTKDCSTNKCFHGGRCASQLHSEHYLCLCPAGYRGKHCETDVDTQCINDNGIGYRGTINYTVSGTKCLKWNARAVAKRRYNAMREDALQLGLGSHNYCRNPDNDIMPWCFVKGANIWKFCDIPKCPPVLTSPCGQRKQKIGKIVGGNVVTIKSHPWQVAVYRKDRRDENYFFHCGASLIHPCWVVTAAHCILPNTLHTDYQVILGKSSTNETSENEQKFFVENITVHQEFDSMTYNNDIALLKLKAPSGMCAKESEFVQMVCLPSQNLTFPDKTLCEVSGYGKEKEFSPFYSKRLKEAKVNLISKQVCTSADYYGSLLTDNMLCAGHPNWKADSCKGDSGGPLVCEDNGRMILYGIVSWGEGCATEKKPGVYTRVTNYIKWIEQNM